MSLDFGMVAQTKTEANESPFLWLPGVDGKFSVQIKGSGTLVASSMALYENGTDVSGTKLSGSLSVSGRVITSKTMSSLVGGSRYQWYIYYTDDGESQVRMGSLAVPPLGVNPTRYAPSAINKLRVYEAPLIVYPSQSFTAVLNVEGRGKISSVTMYAYKGAEDLSSTVLSGSVTIANREITMKTIGSLTGGSEYLIYVYFIDNSKTTCRYFEVLTPVLGA